MEEQLTVNEDYDVQHHHYLKPFVEGCDPWLSVGTVASHTGKTTQTTRKRLQELEALGILNSAPGANGRIYWINDEHSDWPIPPDVDVEGVDENDPRISDLTSRFDVQVGGIAVVLALFSSLAISIPLAALMANIDLMSNAHLDLILIAGFSGALLAALLIFVAVALAILGRLTTLGFLE